MPPAGVKKGSKRARQYEHIKDSLKDQGRSEDTAEEIAARTVNKERARHGESRTASKTSTEDRLSSGERGGRRSGTQAREGPHARPALRRGAAQEHQGPLAHEQGAARSAPSGMTANRCCATRPRCRRSSARAGPPGSRAPRRSSAAR